MHNLLGVVGLDMHHKPTVDLLMLLISVSHPALEVVVVLVCVILLLRPAKTAAIENERNVRHEHPLADDSELRLAHPADAPVYEA